VRGEAHRNLFGALYWPVVAPAFGLLLLGVLVLGALEIRVGVEWVSDWHLRQLTGIALGAAAGAALLLVPYKALVSRAYIAYAVNLFFLVAVLVAGPERNHARRWLPLFGFDFQPSELMKLTLVLTLARFIRFRSSYKTFKGLWAPFLLTLVPMGLILVEPDLGTALLCLPLLFTMLFVAGARARHLLTIALLGALGIFPVYEWGLKPYQKDRIDGFLVQLNVLKRSGFEVQAMAQRENYQLQQSKVAIGSGGWTGVDEGSPVEHTLYRVPERHNDFVFASLGSLGGLFGTLLALLLFGWLLLAILGVAVRHRDPAGRLLCVGVFALFAIQAFVNIAMTVGLLPITGLTLPFLSYGRSSVVVSMLAVALVCNVAARPAYEFGRGDFD